MLKCEYGTIQSKPDQNKATKKLLKSQTTCLTFDVVVLGKLGQKIESERKEIIRLTQQQPLG